MVFHGDREIKHHEHRLHVRRPAFEDILNGSRLLNIRTPNQALALILSQLLD
jgi:hypothetical protein